MADCALIEEVELYHDLTSRPGQPSLLKAKVELVLLHQNTINVLSGFYERHSNGPTETVGARKIRAGIPNGTQYLQ
jgi:hypothetical protein